MPHAAIDAFPVEEGACCLTDFGTVVLKLALEAPPPPRAWWAQGPGGDAVAVLHPKDFPEPAAPAPAIAPEGGV